MAGPRTVADQHHQGGGDSSGKPPAPPPGVTPLHAPIKIPLYDSVDHMRDHLRAQGLLHRPEDVLVIVAPDLAAELYTWAWRVEHPRCHAWPPGRAVVATDGTRMPFELVDLIGKIDEYPVIVRGYLDPGHMGMLPYSMLADNDRTMDAVAEAKARRPK
jgi:hypothetical protein